MPNQATIEILRTNLHEHLAVKAWSELRPGRIEPKCVEILQECNKSAIYRLEGVGPRGAPVIAKRCRTATALIERTIYEEVLPHLPIPVPDYYGFIGEDDRFCWLFLEDVGSERFLPLIEEQRALAVRWLGMMHTSAARVAATARLPDRGPRHYLEHLQSARQAILRSLANAALKPDDLALLETILSQCDVLELHWSQLEKSCEGMPSTLVHGDFSPKNVYIRTEQAGTRLFPIDWETAGWGIPAADLAPTPGCLRAHQLDMTAYWSIVQPFWPHLDLQDIRKLADFGNLFRTLIAVSWESWSFSYPWAEAGMGNMRTYEADLADSIRTLGWKNQ